MRNLHLKQIAALLLAIALLCLCAACGQKQEEPKRSSREIIEEMVVDYGSYGEKAEKRVAELLKELKNTDEDAHARWERIMPMWKSVNTDLALNYDVLPDGLNDTDALAIVVLGFQLNPDGTMREELIQRLTVAKRCAEKYPNALIVCTGGGTASGNKDATEAGRMGEWLIENGVAAERVLVEDQSLTTAQNAVYSLNLLAAHHPQVKEIAIVSSDYHIATGTLLFEAESILRAEKPGKEPVKVVSNAAWKAPSGRLSTSFQAGALIELSGDTETAFDIYYDTYDIHSLPPLE